MPHFFTGPAKRKRIRREEVTEPAQRLPRQLDRTTLDSTTLGFYSFVAPPSALLMNNRRVSSGTRMRAIAPLFLLCTLSGVASAQTTEQCPPTPRAGDLLDCYNGTAPAHVLRNSATSKASTATDKPAAIKGPVLVDAPASKTPTDERAPYVDMLAVENKKLDAKLKTLCRGC